MLKTIKEKNFKIISLSLLIFILFLSPNTFAQEYIEIRIDTTSPFLLSQKEKKLLKSADLRGIPFGYSTNRKLTLYNEKKFEENTIKELEASRARKSLSLYREELIELIMNLDATKNEINDLINEYNNLTYYCDAANRNYEATDILFADIRSSFGNYSDEYVGRYWRTRRNFQEAIEDKEFIFFIVRWTASNLAFLLSILAIFLITKKIYRKKKIDKKLIE